MPSQCELNLLKVGKEKKRKVKERWHRWLKRINHAGFVGRWHCRQCSMAVLNSWSRGHRQETRQVIALAMYSLASWYIESRLDKIPSNRSSLASIGCFYATSQRQFSVCYVKTHLSNVFPSSNLSINNFQSGNILSNTMFFLLLLFFFLI